MNDPYIDLAKKTIEAYLKTGKKLAVPSGLPQELMDKKAGAFVSLHKKDGSLRGCVGTFLPSKENLAEEIISNAIVAAVHDSRFPPVRAEELPDLVYSVDILSRPKPAKKKEIDPKKKGLLVITPDGRRGLLLPDLPGVETAEEQITICKRKAGIAPDEKVSFQTFTVERHGKHQE